MFALPRPCGGVFYAKNTPGFAGGIFCSLSKSRTLSSGKFYNSRGLASRAQTIKFLILGFNPREGFERKPD